MGFFFNSFDLSHETAIRKIRKLTDPSSSPLQYLASLGIQSLVQQGATQGKTAHKLMDALKDTDILHWKHSLSELIEISLAQTTSIWRMYGKR